MKRASVALAWVVLACSLVAASEPRLRPREGGVLHIGGQSWSAFERYSAYLGPGAWPAGAMTYVGLSSLNKTSEGAIPDFFLDLQSNLSAYEPDRFLAVQVGLAFTEGGHGYGLNVSLGHYDAGIEALGRGLAFLGRPVYLRIGYEFNGMGWNGYKPDTYVAAWKRITSKMRATNASNERMVATVWDYSCDDQDNSWVPYWPGDASDAKPDWAGINIFGGDSGPTTNCTSRFVEFADGKGLPVIVGESTPRSVGAGAPWSDWFEGYFDLVAHPSVQAFSYIDWNWTATARWPTWGDCRIEDFPHVSGSRFRSTMKDPSRKIFNGARKDELFKFLNLE